MELISVLGGARHGKQYFCLGRRLRENAASGGALDEIIGHYFKVRARRIHAVNEQRNVGDGREAEAFHFHALPADVWTTGWSDC